MSDPKHIINVLTFPHPLKEITFGFKTQKKDGHSPLRKAEYPKELWAKYPEELNDIKNLYCDFSTTENCDYTISVDLTNSIYFAKHYYHFQIAQYFKEVAHVVHPNFVNATTIWFLNQAKSTSQYNLYFKFSISVRLAVITDQPELIITFDGASKVLKKNILELTSANIETKNFSWLVHKGTLIHHEALPEDANNYLAEYYPVLNPDLANALHYPPLTPKKNDDKYANYLKNIDGLLKKYLNTKGFKKIIPHSGVWHNLETVSMTSEGTNLLKFGEGTHTDPYEGLKAFKPCVPAPKGHYKFFFICHKSDTETANLFHKYLD